MRGLGIPFGRYLLTERLALGGMGEIYLAVQRGLGDYEKTLILKLLLPHLAEEPSAVRMFLDEARLASRMNHPNVVEIFDVGVEGGQYFIAMELVLGLSMAELIRALKAATRQLPPAVLEYVGYCLCEGLHHAHELAGPGGQPLQIVHRDVTPHNVLLSVAGEVKLTDFGIAKARDLGARTRPGIVRGKLAYLAPEQLDGREVDRRADLFGAGVTLFQLATLCSPYQRTTDAEIMAAIRDEPLPSLGKLRPDLPEHFSAALGRATHKDPALRFATARAFRDALAPSFSSQSAEALGRLVREVGRERIDSLREQTRHAAQVGRSGQSRTTDAGGTLDHPPSGGRARARAAAWGAVGAAALAAATAGALVSWPAARGTEAGSPPAAPPATPQSAPPPPPAVQSLAAAPHAPAAAPTVPRAVPPSAEGPASPPGPLRKGAPGVRAQPVQFGYLSVDALPWATVSIGGKKIGDTPIASYPVPRGTVLITLENPETGKRVVRQVKVAGGKESVVKVDLR